MFSTEPIPNAEAAAYLRDLPAVPRAVFDGLLPELKAYAFVITGIERLDVLQQARDLLAAVPEGADWDKTKADLLGVISPWLVDDSADDETRARQQLRAENRAELLLRMHTGRAYAVASYRVMDRQRDVFPYWQYLAMGDNKVRRSHELLDGKIFPASSPFWEKHFPPWEWMCRCQVVPLSQDDVDAVIAEDEGKAPEKQRVMTGAALRKAEQDQEIADPDRAGQKYSLQPASERGGSSPEWQPGLLQIPLGELQKRYEPDIWDQFAAFAEATRIDELGLTVMGWLRSVLPAGEA